MFGLQDPTQFGNRHRRNGMGADAYNTLLHLLRSARFSCSRRQGPREARGGLGLGRVRVGWGSGRFAIHQPSTLAAQLTTSFNAGENMCLLRTARGIRLRMKCNSLRSWFMHCFMLSVQLNMLQGAFKELKIKLEFCNM